MVERLVIVGAGGFGREVLDVVEAMNAVAHRFDVLGFLDDGDPDATTLAPYGVPHLGPIAAMDALDSGVGYVIGIGSPELRRQIDERFRAARACPVLVHPSVTFGRAVGFGPGSVVCAGVRLTNNITVGRHVHLNLNSTVGHDARLGDYVTVSPLVAISGNVTLDDGVMVGTGATFNPGVHVGAGATIGSSAAVLRDVESGVVAVGIPAKPR